MDFENSEKKTSGDAQQPRVLLATQECFYKVAMEQDFGKLQWGGMPEGTIDIYEDRLEFYKKNKTAIVALGLIGSKLAGRGKADLAIEKDMVKKETITSQKNVFRFYLTDGRLAYIQFAGTTLKKEASNAMWQFLK